MSNARSQFTWVACVLALSAAAGFSARARHKKAGDNCPQQQDKPATEVTGFYCNLKALSVAEWMRHHELGKELKAAREDTNELADGYAYRLDSRKAPLADVAEWVAQERRCCPFFDFEIALERDGGPLWLKLRGKEGVKQFIRDEFGAKQ
ncbi:MAG: hypothetical protein ACRD50_02910 [Candidatus Acidiferrales bacterium]